MNNWKKICSGALSNNIEYEVLLSETKDIQQIEDKFEFAIIFNSSEKRSLLYQNVFKKKPFKSSVLVDFKMDECEEKRSNYINNKKVLSTLTTNSPIELPIDNTFQYKDNLERIIQTIPESTFSIGSKIFIDISSVPLIYSVALLRFLKLSFPSPKICLFNVSAKYDKNQNNKYDFSDGIIKNIYIPGYHGYIDHSKPRLYIFLLGFEGDKSFSVYKKSEPNFVEVIVPSPGYETEYPDETIYNNQTFLKEAEFIIDIDVDNYIDADKSFIKVLKEDKPSYFKILKDIHNVDIGNPIAVCENIISICNQEKYKDKVNICLVPLGPKPHALGAALAAIIDKNISIMYQVPKSYSLSKTASGEKMWIYKIK